LQIESDDVYLSKDFKLKVVGSAGEDIDRDLLLNDLLEHESCRGRITMRNLIAVVSLVALAPFTTAGLSAAEENSHTTNAHVDLSVGAAAPIFKSIDDRGRPWASGDHVGKQYVVIYFYPADFTTGCTKQAESFRDTMNTLTDQDVAVIGVSGDSVLNHHLFKQTWKLNFTLLADDAGQVAAKFGVPTLPGGKVVPRGPDRKILMDENGKPIRLERKTSFARWTFIIGKDGKILYKNTKVHPVNDSKQVLGFIEKLKKESKSAL